MKRIPVSLLLSAESISLLRTDSEMQQLLSLMPRGYIIHTLLVTRDNDEWWESYCNHIRKKGKDANARPESPQDLNPNGWLRDFDTLRAVLRRNSHQFTEIPYCADIVPAMLAAMKVAATPTHTARLSAVDPCGDRCASVCSRKRRFSRTEAAHRLRT